MKYQTTVGVVLIVASFLLNSPVLAYSANPQPLELDPVKTVTEVSSPVNQVLNGLFKGFSAGSLGTTGANTSSGSDSGSYSVKLFNLGSLSGGDLGSALKAITILFINVFLVVINIVSQILKGILGAISG